MASGVSDLALRPPGPSGLGRDELIHAFRIMYLSRRIDDREILLKRQSKIYFQISGAGHEAIQTAAGMVLKPGHDWFFPYYRDRALCLTLGMTPEDMLLQAVGAESDPSSGGRQMPSHWSNPRLHIVSPSSATGTQFLPAIGCADAQRRLEPGTDAITVTTTGDGATSEGEFWESLNVACLEKLAILYLVEDNGWAISVPVEKQTAGGNIAKLVSGFPNLKIFECDGTDFLASYATMSEAVAHCRRQQSPVLVHARCTRPYSHSLSDDERLYKTKAERAAEAARDPIVKFPEWLISQGLLEPHGLELLTHEVEFEIQEVGQRVLKAAPPPPGSALRFLYSDLVDPTSKEFETEPRFSGDPRTMVDAINLTLHEEMRRNDKIVLFGEDVADCSHEDNLKEVKGKGGVFKATQGLQTVFGSQRVFNTPIAEAAIVGRGAGMATRGLKPIVEIQFFDYIWPAMMQIRDELASLRWRSYNGFSAPMVIRVTIGGYLNGGAIYHSQCGEVDFHPHSRPARGVSVERFGRLRPAADRHPLRRSGSVPGTQETISRGLQSLAASRPGLYDPLRQSQDRQNRLATDYRDLRSSCSEVAASSAARRAAQSRSHRGSDRSAHAFAVRLGSDSRLGRKNQPRDGGARGYALLGLRRRNLGAHCQRAVLLARRPRRPHRRAGHLGRLPPKSRSRDSASGRQYRRRS